MSLIKEVHDEAKELTRQITRRHYKKILSTALVLGALFTFSFYATGVGFFEERFSDNPLVLAFIIASLQSVVALLVSQLAITYFFAFTKCSTRRAYIACRRFGTKTVSIGIHENLQQLRDDDYVAQIDEMKAGVKHEISEVNTDLNGWKKFTGDLARRFSLNTLSTNQKIITLQNEVSKLREEIRVLKEAKKQEEQLRDEKLGIKNNNDAKSDNFKDIDDAK
ncbi:MAG TPA: hypothetical protein VNK25_05555 [Candidatus Nitrosotenuis sp.]|nr:hypothetical protein [Candidatus Nitrosotenuis sp.]